MKYKTVTSILILVIIGLFFLFFYWKLSTPKYLTFSDGAKMADIARNLALGSGYGGRFSSFGADKMILDHLGDGLFPRFDRQPLMPVSIAAFFNVFGINDDAVMMTSIFYYLLTAVFLYLLGRKVFGQIVGYLSAITFLSIPFFWDYALNGASETLFALEVVLTFYLFSFQKNKTYILAFIVAILSYFTRPQGFLLISAAVFYYFFMRERKVKMVIVKFLIIAVVAVVIDLVILSKFTGKTFLYSVLSKGADVSVLYTEKAPATTGLRQSIEGKEILLTSLPVVAKKVFYNLYNLYKLLPSIASPYIWTLFIVALFLKSKNKDETVFKWTTFYLIAASFLFTSVSIPFFRYIHPFIPLVILFSVVTLYRLIAGSHPKIAHPLTFAALLIFVIGQSLGIIFLDSRFLRQRVNHDKKPIYVQLSEILKHETEPDTLGLTNLDTWGTWYGDRKTVWLPTSPIDSLSSKGEVGFDYIYLTSYLMDDENYHLSEGWRQMLLNPDSPDSWVCDGCEVFSEDFILKNVYEIPDTETYEKISARAVLFVRK